MSPQRLMRRIRKKKVLYILDRLLPYTHDSVIVEVKESQLDWLAENQGQIWGYFLSEDLLYSSNWKDIRKYVTYSPNSPGMPPEAPGRTANWIGWQMVTRPAIVI